jgi:integrase
LVRYRTRSTFNRATDWDLYNGVNPIRKVLKQDDPEALTRFLSLDEVLTLFSACDKRILPIVAFALLTGLRKSEALWFEWKDVASDLRFIKAHRRKKGGFPDIPVSDKLRHLLLHLGPRPEGRLFEISPQQFRDSFEAAREKAGLKHFSWRDLRRTFASQFTMATKDRPSLKKLLGHRTNFMVDRYAYLDDDHLQTQMDTFDARMPDLPAALSSDGTVQKALVLAGTDVHTRP